MLSIISLLLPLSILAVSALGEIVFTSETQDQQLCTGFSYGTANPRLAAPWNDCLQIRFSVHETPGLYSAAVTGSPIALFASGNCLLQVQSYGPTAFGSKDVFDIMDDIFPDVNAAPDPNGITRTGSFDGCAGNVNLVFDLIAFAEQD